MALGQEPRNLCGQGNIVWDKRALGVCVCVCGHKGTRECQPRQLRKPEAEFYANV